MDVHKDEFRPLTPSRIAQWLSAVVVWLSLHTVAHAAEPLRHFDLEAGDASVTLVEFSRQSELQVLFNFNLLKGVQTHEVHGDFEPATALTSMLKGTNLMHDFVNDHTLAVTPKRPLLARVFKVRSRPQHPVNDDMEQVLISGSGDSGTQPLLGAQTLQFSRLDIDRSGYATAQDFLRTLPQVFGGGPTEDTVLGREAGTNSARGSGVNLRGLDAGATLVLIDGKRLAPSGTQGTFEDVSNIPLSLVDHIDLLPDGASARYGADAVGGVINFVTRANLSGMQTQARGGHVTDGSMGERQFSQLFGNIRDSGNDLLGFEYFQRDALQASDRAQFTSDLTRFGGSNFNWMYGNPGTITDGVNFWPIPKGLSGTPSVGSLTQGVPNLYDRYQGADVTPRQQRWSLFGKERQKLTDHVVLSLEGLFTRRTIMYVPGNSSGLVASVPESNPFYVNPTGIPGPVTVIEGTTALFGPPTAEDHVDTGNFALGVSTSAYDGWTAGGYLGYAFEKQRFAQRGQVNQDALAASLADSNPATAFNPFGDAGNNNPATLATISGISLFDSVSSLKTINLSATGPVLFVPGGYVELSVGAEYRIQTIETARAEPDDTSAPTGGLRRNIRAAFADARVPLIGESNERGLAQRLELSIGLRREDYSDIGSATVPKFGLFWSISKELSFRSTWTKSFRPPNLTDMVANNSYSTLFLLPDPSSPAGMTTVLGRYGTNSELRPERARTWTLGTDLNLKSLPGLSLSLTYFNINYAGRIADAQFGPNVLSLPSFGWLINRKVTAAELNEACAHSTFQGPGTCTDPSITAIIDNRLRNIAQLRTDGLDLIGRYSLESRAGKFDFGLNGTYLFAYSQANTPGSPLADIVSTQNNPINIRARGSASWSRQGLGVSAFVTFENSYRDTLSVPNRGVSPWTTIDLQLSYETGGDTLGWLGHTQFVLNAQNLFDVNPPFLNNNAVGLGYDQENADLYGRMVSFEVRKRW